MKPNPEKWHLLLSETSDTRSLKIGHQLISNSETEKILGVTFDNKLSFKCYVDKICKKASQKLSERGFDHNNQMKIMICFLYNTKSPNSWGNS